MWNALIAGMVIDIMVDELMRKRWVDAAISAGIAALNLWVALL